MADQTIRLSNIPPTLAKERVAYDLYIDVLRVEKSQNEERTRKYLLDLFAECLQATNGYRTI